MHRLRALTLLLDAAGAAFAARNGLSTTDVRALVCLAIPWDWLDPRWLHLVGAVADMAGGAARDRVRGWIDRGVEDGATLVVDGRGVRLEVDLGAEA